MEVEVGRSRTLELGMPGVLKKKINRKGTKNGKIVFTG